MKNYFLIIFFIVFPFIINAQTKKGDIDIFIQAAPFSTTGEVKDFGLIGLAGVEFFILDNLSLSTNFFSSNNTFFKNETGETINSFGIIPTLQYYALNKEKWNVYGQAGYGIGFEDQKTMFVNKSSLVVWNVGLGANYNINECLYVKLLVPYFHAQNVTRNFTSANGLTAFIGIGYKFKNI